MKQKLYDKAVDVSLKFYEKYVLPSGGQKLSLRELKLQEFRDRKKLLNPYQKEELLRNAVDADAMKKLGERASIKTMYTFNITTDRFAGKYGYRTGNFPKSYSVHDLPIDYAYDPDWTVKIRYERLNLKKIILVVGLIYYFLSRRVYLVEQFDKRKRYEQRAMQNQEIADVYNKKVKFVLTALDNKDFSE